MTVVNEDQLSSQDRSMITIKFPRWMMASLAMLSILATAIAIPQGCVSPDERKRLCLCISKMWHQQGSELQGTGVATCLMTAENRHARRPVRRFLLNGMRDATGRAVTNARVEGGALMGDVRGVSMSPEDWVGVKLVATVDCMDSRSTEQLDARIASVKPYDGKVPGLAGQAYVYELEIYNPLTDTWEPACELGDQGQIIGAIPSAEVWDTTGTPHDEPGAFTFAGLNAAIGKCYDWGYVPWLGITAKNLHLACTRAVRADYFGDGNSHTKPGMWIDMWDNGILQIPGIDRPAEASFEAIWGPQGAICVNHVRSQVIARESPSLLSRLPGPCTFDPPTGELIFTISIPQ